MKKLYLLVGILISISANAQLIAEWNFNSTPSDFNLNTGVNIPCTGMGTIANVGLVNNQYDFGKGSSDPERIDNTCYSTNNYPNATANDKSAGIEIGVNTTGLSNIVLKFNLKCFHAAANEYVVQYSIDGTTFFDITTINITPADTAKFLNNNVVDASSIIGLNNNPNAKFRIVSSFAGNGNTYVAVNDSIDVYNPTGKVNFDMISVTALSTLSNNVFSFTAVSKNNKNVLAWAISNEINLQKYVIERSDDARIFTEIGVVNATQNNKYSFTDGSAKNAINFYRLKLISLNGVKYSNVVKVVSELHNRTINIYPSPAQNFINAEFTSSKKVLATMQITDGKGAIFLQKNAQLKQGLNNMNFDVRILNKGTYFLRILMGDDIFSGTFNKL